MRVACSFGVVATLLASACAAASPNPAPARPQPVTSPAGAQPNAGPPASGAGQGQGPSVGTNIAARTGGMERRAGLIPLYLDDRQGEQRAHYASMANDFARWIERRELPALSPALRPPPGDPFGEDDPS